MKLICSKEYLLDGINIVQKAVSAKTTLQILEGILLEAEDTLKLTGNDLEIGIECLVEADIKEKGTIVLNSRMFGEIIRKLPNSDVLIEVKQNNMVIIECENSHFELKGLPSSGFPALPTIEKQNSFSIPQKVLRDMIKQTIFAISIDENRPTLTGSLFEYDGNILTIVSIDGFRLALRKSEIAGGEQAFSVIIPGKTLNEISKILQPVDESAIVSTSKNQILFDLGNCKIVSRLLEGEFMNYKNVIPTEFGTTTQIDTKNLTSSFERASLITMDEKKYPVKLAIDDESLIISSNTEIGAVREEIKVDLNGSRLEIGFNPKYFIDALKAIDEEMININFTSSIGPSTITPIDGNNFIYMILPVRIKNE